MEGDTVIINSNNSCLTCFEKLGKAHHTKLIYPIHELSRKLNIDLGNVFPDMQARFGNYKEDFSKVLSKLQVFCSMCQDCAYICIWLEQSDLSEPSGEVKVHAKLLLDKISKVELSNGCEYADYLKTPDLMPLALVHFGIVERFRMELKKMLQIVKENPLENDIVQCNILSFLEISEVKKCRFLNKQWNSNCYHTLKHRTSSSSSSKKEYQFRLLFPSRISGMGTSELISQLKSGSQYPLAQKISVDGWFFGKAKNERVMLRFFNAVSTKITDLTLNILDSKFYDYEIMYPPGLALPHLASFCLKIDHCLRSFWQSEFIKGIIQNSPNLKEISICKATFYPPSSSLLRLEDTPAEVYQPLVDALLEKQVVSHLTSLCLKSKLFYSTHYDQLAKAGFKLKKLQLFPTKETVVSVKHFLEGQLESLEELKVNFDYEQFELGRMRLAKLKVLKIFGHMCHMQDCYCQNVWNFNQHISYKKNFPVLEELQLQNFNDEFRLGAILHLGRSEDNISKSVKKLKLSSNVVPSPQIIENAAELFPNLTKFKVLARPEILKKICVKMAKLQGLILLHDAVYMKCAGIKMDNILMGVLPDMFNPRFNPDESLLRLTELRTLRIKIITETINVEQACRHIFMKMESLKLITFAFSYSSCNDLTFLTGIPPSLLDELKKKLVIQLVAEICSSNLYKFV